MYNKLFWTDAVERAVRTVAQGILSVVTINGFDLLHADPKAIMSVGLTAGLISLLMSLVAAKKDSSSASFVVENTRRK